MPLICKPLAQGQMVPEMLEVVVYRRPQATCFYSSKQVCLTPLCLIYMNACEQEVYRQEIRQDVCLSLIGPDGKCSELWVLPF